MNPTPSSASQSAAPADTAANAPFTRSPIVDTTAPKVPAPPAVPLQAAIKYDAALSIARIKRKTGKLAEAIPYLRTAIAEDPSRTDAAADLGEILHTLKRYDESHQLLTEALARHPDDYRLNFAMGNTCGALNRFAEAAAHYRVAAVACPEQAMTYNNLGHMLRKLGENDEAIIAFNEAILRQPKLVIAHGNLADVLFNLGRHAEALTAAERLLSLDPASSNGLFIRGRALTEAKRYLEAAKCFEEGLERHPGESRFRLHLGGIHYNLGNIEQARAHYHTILEKEPRNLAARCNALFMSNYRALDPAVVLAEHRAYAEYMPTRAARANSAARREGRLRIGYLSPDFNQHPVGNIIAPVLAAHDREQFEVFAYYNKDKTDDLTTRIKGYDLHWRSVHNVGDRETAELIDRDELDLLIDLTGHTGGNRLGVMSLRPAPVQATWLGYPNTTGISAIDYRITCAASDPVGLTESFHVEKLARLDPTFLTSGAPRNGAPVAPSPVFAEGHITFGCFNNLAKISPAAVETWARILHAVPCSKLLLKSNPLGDLSVARDWVAKFEAHGIDPARITTQSRSGYDEHLALFGKVDIALDPFPYNGTATTIEGLWMGVPHVTLAGDRHVARVGVSLLRAVGHDELIASTLDDYVRISCELADHPERLAVLRSGLRERLQASPLGDATKFTRNHLEPLLVRIARQTI